MRELEYPFNAEEIIRRKKAIRKELLSQNEDRFIEKKIAVLGGSTTRDICLTLELFLLNNGIRPVFYESEYNRYYQDADNVIAAQGSLDADMGVFSFLPFDSLKAAGNYGMFFSIQLLCLVIVLCAYLFLFSVLKTAMENIRDTGRAYSEEDAAKAKKNFIFAAVFILLFNGVFGAVVAGILLCGLYNVTFVSER